MNKPTTVISVRGCKPASLLADPDFRYVGRQCAGWSRSVFANPFKVAEYGDEALSLFERCLAYGLGEDTWSISAGNASDEAFRRMAAQLPSLRGKTLGCWCGSWAPGQPEIGCHAVVLAKLANALTEGP